MIINSMTYIIFLRTASTLDELLILAVTSWVWVTSCGDSCMRKGATLDWWWRLCKTPWIYRGTRWPLTVIVHWQHYLHPPAVLPLPLSVQDFHKLQQMNFPCVRSFFLPQQILSPQLVDRGVLKPRHRRTKWIKYLVNKNLKDYTRVSKCALENITSLWHIWATEVPHLPRLNCDFPLISTLATFMTKCSI